MRNIKLTISYDGTAYKGWQSQANGRTVQDQIEKAIKKVFGKKHTLYGASRTDSGVHAKCQAANFKTTNPIPLKKIAHALNAYLDEDIAVVKAEEAGRSFHARFDARGKHYRYQVLLNPHRDPFEEKYSWRVPYKLNVPRMRREAKVLLGRHDFKAFQAADKRERSSTRRITRLDIKKRKDHLVLDIEGDGFLYNMVRNIVGTLVDIGRGYLPEASMKTILKSRDRRKAGPTAPAKGLFLIKVKY